MQASRNLFQGSYFETPGCESSSFGLPVIRALQHEAWCAISEATS
jgi:hypothetical protein